MLQTHYFWAVCELSFTYLWVLKTQKVRHVQEPMVGKTHLMQAQKNLALPTLPEQFSARTRKDDLYNAIIDLLEQMDLSWHLHVLKLLLEKSISWEHCAIPLGSSLHGTSMGGMTPFGPFTQHSRYVFPVSRVQQTRIVKASETRSYESQCRSSEFFTFLLNPFFKKSPHWCMFQVLVELLAKSLSSYANGLGEKNKHMKSRHSSSAFSRQVEDNVSNSFLPVSALWPSMLDVLNHALAVTSELGIIRLSCYSPSDSRQKYRYILCCWLTSNTL